MERTAPPANDAQQRFSNRVEDYIKYRPGYPPQVLQLLQSEAGLDASWAVADVGSGTGILTELFLKNGNAVFAIEPNKEMREAAERLLPAYENFHSVAGSAEDTTLEPSSVDLVVAAQAFHWFDRGRARAEFKRVLRPSGWVSLIWNDRETDTTPFLREYELALRNLGLDYQQVNHRNIDEQSLREWFGPDFRKAEFPNSQRLDWAGLRGRALSSSYVPALGHPKHDAFFGELEQIFRRHERQGYVSVEYTTQVFYGRLL